jgi:hypothetical protein
VAESVYACEYDVGQVLIECHLIYQEAFSYYAEGPSLCWEDLLDKVIFILIV